MIMKNNKSLDDKIIAYVDHLFAGVGATQQLFDLKEELITNIRKIADYKSIGMAETGFHEASSMATERWSMTCATRIRRSRHLLHHDRAYPRVESWPGITGAFGLFVW